MIWCNSVCNLIYCNCCSLTCTDCNATINKRYDWILVALVYGYSSGVVTAVGVCYGYRVGIWRCDGQVGSRVSGRPLEVAIAFSSERDFGYVAGEKLRAGAVGDGNRNFIGIRYRFRCCSFTTILVSYGYGICSCLNIFKVLYIFTALPFIGVVRTSSADSINYVCRTVMTLDCLCRKRCRQRFGDCKYNILVTGFFALVSNGYPDNSCLCCYCCPRSWTLFYC